MGRMGESGELTAGPNKPLEPTRMSLVAIREHSGPAAQRGR